jgi:hypothetical protein
MKFNGTEKNLLEKIRKDKNSQWEGLDNTIVLRRDDGSLILATMKVLKEFKR